MVQRFSASMMLTSVIALCGLIAFGIKFSWFGGLIFVLYLFPLSVFLTILGEQPFSYCNTAQQPVDAPPWIHFQIDINVATRDICDNASKGFFLVFWTHRDVEVYADSFHFTCTDNIRASLGPSDLSYSHLHIHVWNSHCIPSPLPGVDKLAPQDTIYYREGHDPVVPRQVPQSS
jgi:hypothetical protein